MISPHGGHRERVRKRFREEGLEHFEDHQVLELLLFYVIPRGDTNDIAHELLKQFGSLSAVLNAPIGELVRVPGIGEQAALFLTLMPQLVRRYQKDLSLRESRAPILNSVEAVSAYVQSLMLGRPEEAFYVLCLDVRCRLLKAVLISEGTSRETAVYPSKVAEAALRHRASSVIFVHNHPAGSLSPSSQDRQLTRRLVQALGPLSIRVLDHLIVAGEGVYSFAEQGIPLEYVSPGE